MKKPIKKVAVVHDLCTYGKAAFTNIIPVLSVMGLEVCPIPTMVLSTHTGGFGMPYISKLPQFIEGATEHFKRNEIEFDGIFIGYLGSEEMINSTINFLKEYGNQEVIIDPIFGDNGKCYSNFDSIYVEQMRSIISYSTIITPNYTEACFLANEEYTEDYSEDKIKKVCNKLFKLGAKNIIITSVPNDDEKSISMAICEGNIERLKIIRKDKCKESYHGTGDIFTSVLIGEIMRKANLEEASLKAHEFVKECIDESLKYDYPKKEGVLLEKKLYLLV